MIRAVEQGRSLVVTVGDGDEAIVLNIPPVPTKVGMGLMALWAGIVFGQSNQAETDADQMSRTAIGADNWEQLEELRWAESSQVINSALLWNIQGGGIDVVNEFLRDGFPKAQETLLKANDLWDEFSLLMTFLSGASENQTQSPDGTPDTNTRRGTSDSSGSTLDRLPESKRSINQNG